VIVCGVVRLEPTARASENARVTWLAQVTPLARDTREFATRIARGDRVRGETVRLNLRSTRWTRWTVVGGRRTAVGGRRDGARLDSSRVFARERVKWYARRGAAATRARMALARYTRCVCVCASD
jgi:hypothetical protein